MITEAEQMIAQFYAGDRPIKNEAINDALFLPPVDNVDQAKQRISLLAEMLKPRYVCFFRGYFVTSNFPLSRTSLFSFHITVFPLRVICWPK